MKLGIVGLPNVGKSTLFNSLTKGKADAANYPFCTIDPNVGIVTVPDKRLEVLNKMYNSKKIIPAIIEFVDIAGLVRGAGKGEGLGNKFLSHIREVDAIIHVVRCFDDPNIVHVDGNIDPLRDIETIQLELIFSDLEMIERRILRTQKSLKGDKTLKTELDLLKRLKEELESGKQAVNVEMTEEEREISKNFHLLTSKKVIYAANVSEDDLVDISSNPYARDLIDYASQENSQVVFVSASLEEEISELSPDEKSEFLKDLGIKSTGLEKLITASYSLLNLISYITAGEMETRAWTIEKGTKAPQAAGKIHSDFEKGFIRAETISYDDLVEAGSMAAAREKGLLRQEGKDYIVKDGDVILFKFNV